MALSPAMKSANVALWFLETELISLPVMSYSEWAYVLPCSQLFWVVYVWWFLGVFLVGALVKVEMGLIPY